MKHEQDQPTIGLLLCKSKNKVVAEYALGDKSQPLGIAEYKLQEALPEELKILFKDECYAIQGAIFEVYREMGCGFLESVSQECLERECDPETSYQITARKTLASAAVTTRLLAPFPFRAFRG
jgi:hypothetical protein